MHDTVVVIYDVTRPSAPQGVVVLPETLVLAGHGFQLGYRRLCHPEQGFCWDEIPSWRNSCGKVAKDYLVSVLHFWAKIATPYAGSMAYYRYLPSTARLPSEDQRNAGVSFILSVVYQDPLHSRCFRLSFLVKYFF